jgi:nitroreductase
MENFLPVDEKANFDTDTFIRFIRNRRSHRHFKNKPIPRQELAKLIDACRYTPTGSNVQTVEILVIQDREKINHVSNQTVYAFVELKKRAIQKIESLTSGGSDTEYLNRIKQYGDRLQEAKEAGIDPIFHDAGTVLFFHSPRETSTPKDNCVIASTTLSLLARTMGIESTYIGLVLHAIELNRDILTYLHMPPENEMYSVLIMGYPRLKYLYTVDRKPIATRFE